MFLMRLSAAALLVVLFSLEAQAQSEPRIALVVTNEAYVQELGPLKFPHSDGDNVSAALRRLGFQIRLLRDGSRAQFERDLSAYISDLKRAGRDAVGVFYFSGHTWHDGKGTNYFILNEKPTRASAIDLNSIGIRFRQVTDALRTTQARANFVVIDSHLETVEPALLEQNPSLMFMARGRPGLGAFDNNDFSKALANALLTPGLDALRAFKKVQVEMTELTNGKQVPWIGNNIQEPFYFRREDARKQAAAVNENISGRRVALVIANSRYRHSAVLANPQNDGRAVADALRKLNFADVQEYYDLDRQSLLAALRRFGEAAETSDWAVVYYAGHGLEAGGKNYLLPVDAKLDKEQDIEDEAVPVSRLFDRLAPAKGIKIVILDACRDNPLATRSAQRAGRRNLTVSKGLAKMDAESGTLIALAADPGMPAYDGSGLHSPYASALLRHIFEPGLDIRLMFGKVYETIREEMQGKQEPWIQAKLSGRQYFFRPQY